MFLSSPFAVVCIHTCAFVSYLFYYKYNKNKIIQHNTISILIFPFLSYIHLFKANYSQFETLCVHEIFC